MESNVIKFHSCHVSNKDTDHYPPVPVKEYIPQWFRDKDKYRKHGDRYDLMFATIKGKQIVSRVPTWKSCPALVDVFTTGYYFLTPCDITFKINTDDNRVPVDLIFDEKWANVHKDSELGHFKLSQSICRPRSEEEGMPVPEGYHSLTYTWFSNYFIQIPEGYTALFTHPMNINDLPFKTISGFSDASNFMTGPGNLPFYIKKGWEGTIPAGTPFAQIIPFKNESWKSEIIQYTDEEIEKYLLEKHNEYMTGHSTTKYKELDWLKKHYE